MGVFTTIILLVMCLLALVIVGVPLLGWLLNVLEE